MKKLLLFLLLSLSIICWEVKAMERLEEDTSERNAEIQDARKEGEIEEAIKARDQEPANPITENTPELEEVESFVEVSIFEGTPLTPTHLSNGMPQEKHSVDTSDLRIPSPILKKADNRLNLLNARIKKLREQYPKEKELMEFLISYRDEFQEIYHSVENYEYPKPLPILGPFSAPNGAIQEKEASLPASEEEHSCHDNMIKWEEETIKQLLAEPPEINRAHESLKIATCYRKAMASFKEASERYRQAAVTKNREEASLLQKSASKTKELGYVLINQAEALEKALEAGNPKIAPICTTAADKFQKSSEYYRASLEPLAKKYIEEDRLLEIARTTRDLGDTLIRQAEALKGALEAKAEYPEVAQICTTAADEFQKSSEYYEASLEPLAKNSTEENQLKEIARTIRDLGDTLIRQAEALKGALEARKAEYPEVAQICTAAADKFHKASEHYRQSVQAIEKGNLEKKNEQMEMADEAYYSAEALMQEAQRKKVDAKEQDLLDQEAWEDMESDGDSVTSISSYILVKKGDNDEVEF